MLYVISNIIYAIEGIELLSFIDSELIPLCLELLMTLKEPHLLVKILNIIELILYKGDPMSYVNDFYKDSDDKILNPFKYQFDSYGLYDILSNIYANTKSTMVTESIKRIMENFYDIKKIAFH